MASSGVGRGRGAGGGAHVPALGTGIAARECESCRAAPGIPFCRVEWSFLCAGCASVIHGQSWIVSVPPNLNSVSGSHTAPYSYQHTCPLNPSPIPSSAAPNPNPNPSPLIPSSVAPNPNPNPSPMPIPNSNPGHVVQLSSDEEEQSSGDPGDDDDGSGGRKRRRPSSEGESAGRREASMMRYKEKRKNRNFDKTIRYQSRQAHAELTMRVGGKFVKSAADAAGEGEEGVAGGGELDSAGDAVGRDSSEEARANTVTASPSFEVEQFGAVEIDAVEEVALL